MKLLTLAALAAFTLHAQQTPAPAKAEQTKQTLTPQERAAIEKMDDRSVGVEAASMTAPPALTADQKLTIRDAQFADQQFAEYMKTVIQPQLDKMPEYVRLKERAKATLEAASKVSADVAKTCADCNINYDTLTLSRKQADKPKEK